MQSRDLREPVVRSAREYMRIETPFLVLTAPQQLTADRRESNEVEAYSAVDYSFASAWSLLVTASDSSDEMSDRRKSSLIAMVPGGSGIIADAGVAGEGLGPRCGTAGRDVRDHRGN